MTIGFGHEHCLAIKCNVKGSKSHLSSVELLNNDLKHNFNPRKKNRTTAGRSQEVPTIIIFTPKEHNAILKCSRKDPLQRPFIF